MDSNDNNANFAVPTVYWPTPCPGEENEDGYIVGWANGDAAFVVSSVVSEGEVAKTLDCLRHVQQAHTFADLRKWCSGIPCLIGEWRGRGRAGEVRAPKTTLLDSVEVFPFLDCQHSFITASIRAETPPSTPSSRGSRSTASLTPVVAKNGRTGRGAEENAKLFLAVQETSRPKRPIARPYIRLRARDNQLPLPLSINVVLYNPPNILSLQSFASRVTRTPPIHALGATAVLRVQGEMPKTAFDCVLNQLNASNFLASTIAEFTFPVMSPDAQAGNLRQELAAQRHSAAWYRRALRSIIGPFLLLLVAARSVAVSCLQALQWRFSSSIPLLGGFALYEMSTLARQVHLKLWEFCMWPRILFRMHRIRSDVRSRIRWHSSEVLFRETAAWYDSVNRTLVDLLVGIGVCIILARFPWAVRLVLGAIHSFGEILHIDVLRAWVDWLMGLPAGLKLNHFASKKIGGAVLYCIDSWEYITAYTTPFEPAIVVVIGGFGFGGISLLLALVSDVLDLATIHLYVLYSQFAWLHNKLMGLLSSLWKLFRGKKFNVLRNRVDSNDYDVAQLLLGTLFFTVVFFLFPTTTVYYAFFLMVWLGILSTRALVWWLITMMNNVSVYTFYCTIFGRRQVPAGVRLHLMAVSGNSVEIKEEFTAAIMARSQFGSHSYLGDSPSITRHLTSAEPPVLSWYRLESCNAGIDVALIPFKDALSVVAQRYSVGMLLRSIFFGERGFSLFRSVSPGSKSGTAHSPSGVSATGLAFGVHNAAANAPVEGPAAAKLDKQTITELVNLDDSAIGTWQVCLRELETVADDLCFT